MSQATIITIFVLAIAVTIIRGVGWAFVLVYLPALIMLNQIPQIDIAHAPLAPQFAPLYGMLIGMPFRGESLRFKWCMVDTIFVLLLISSTITAWTTEYFETGVNSFRTELMTWVAPYFFARMVFRPLEIRQAGLKVLIALIAMISVAALIEFRVQPYWYLHVLKNLGMGNFVQPMAYYRFGFNRVSGTVQHPIYFGNMCLVLLGMVAVLAKTTGAKFTNGWVGLALFGAFGCIVTSISFTPYMGFFAGLVVLLTLVGVPFTRKLLIPSTLGVILVMFAFTYDVAHSKLGPKPDGDGEGSLWTRKLIINESWKKAVTSGPFGYGRLLDFGEDADDDFDLSSVDNSYMLFTMARGWVYTTLWISIAVFFSIRMQRAFNAVQHKSQIFPLAAATATVLGLMVSMYTVWAGAVYVVVWAVMLGLSNTIIDQVLDPSIRLSLPQRRRGFPVAQPGNMMPGMPGMAFPNATRMQSVEGY